MPEWQLAMESGAPKRITILAWSLYGGGCPCDEEFGFAGGDILPFFVRNLPGTEGSWPPRVHGGAFTLTGYFTGRRIDTYDWYAAFGTLDAQPEEGADYASRHLEFVVEGWCFHPPKPDPQWDELFAESTADMHRRGMPFCKTQNACFERYPALPTGACSRDLVSKKAHLIGDRALIAEWDAAKLRYLFGLPSEPRGKPSAALSVETWDEADLGAVTSGLVGVPDFMRPTRVLRFPDAESAIDAVPRLLCNPDVASVEMLQPGGWQDRYGI